MNNHDEISYGLALSSKASKSEFSEDAMARYFNQFKESLDKLVVESERWSTGRNILLDASGNGKIEIDFPDGRPFDLRRVILWADGFTPASGSSTGWVGLYHNAISPANLFDFAPPTPGSPVFPQLSEYPAETDPIFKMNEKLVIAATGCVANINIAVMIWGNLQKPGSI